MSVPTAGQGGTAVDCRPHHEGANIRTWIGFKHFMYLVEEAVLQWFRDRGCGPRMLFHDHGLGLAILDSSVHLPHLMEVDDEVVAIVQATGSDRFAVRLHLKRPGGAIIALRGRVVVGLIRADAASATADLPEGLPVIPVTAPAPEDPPTAASPDGFTWRWRARYFHCHYSEHVQHSAYVRCLEEVVDRFLDAQDMAIPALLHERGWIPVVSRARVRLTGPSYLDEEIETTFTVRDVLKATAFDASMDCHVTRDGARVRVATASILHGYAASRGPDAGSLVTLDDAIQRQLLRKRDR